MIRIGGLGISGLYLYWRLKNDGFDVTGTDKKKDNFYIPCGYATNERLMQEYMSRINFDFQEYVLSRADNIIFAGNNFQNRTLEPSGLCTFDKNMMEKDASKGIEHASISSTEKSLIVDATGISRSFLGRSQNDVQYYTLEYLTDKSEYDNFYFYFLEHGRGYFWSFPLGDRCHVGIGSTSKEDLVGVREYKPLKITSRNIRLKPLFDSLHKDNVIGIGEAIGTVSPITGEGIMPSIRSAEILYQCIKRYEAQELAEAYRQRIIKEFGYYSKLHQLVSSIQSGKILSINNISSIKYVKRTVNDFGIKFEILPFLKHFI
jgi:flavin-dependent dehydrogenase